MHALARERAREGLGPAIRWRAVRVSDESIALALPVLERELAAHPAPALAEMVERMRERMRERAEAYARERAEIVASLAANGYGPLSGPVDTAADSAGD